MGFKNLFWIFTSFLFFQDIYAWPIKEKVLFYEGNSTGVNKKWLKLGSSPEESVKFLLKILEKSPSGKNIILQAKKKAQERGRPLESLIVPGENSITDTTLIRHFSVDNPDDVTFEIESIVVINEDHSIENAILDLAHELVHFVHKSAFNPYGKHFDVKKFIDSTLEGKGGEIEAYLQECAVMSEIMEQRFFNDDNCQSVYFPENEKLSLRLSRRAFFQLGKYMDDFLGQLSGHQLLKQDFPEITSSEAKFISSAYKLPYPYAALKEYQQIMKKVCENDSQRFKYLKRSPASISTSSYTQQLADYRSRCRAFL